MRVYGKIMSKMGLAYILMLRLEKKKSLYMSKENLLNNNDIFKMDINALSYFIISFT
jgi:hypothetical protein